MQNNNGIRINKYLSQSGICSRREADRRIGAGRVTINGTAAVPGMTVTPGDTVCVDGKPVGERPEPLYFKFYKPAGVVCTTASFDKDNIVDFINYPERIYPVGRLDKESTGLILLTNDGEIVNPILKASNHHEKEYLVTVANKIGDMALDKLRKGVRIPEAWTRPCIVKRLGARRFKIIITQGLNRQIRKMCEAVGHEVTELHRVRIMDIHIGDMQCGELRPLTEREKACIFKVSREGEHDR
ncbi:MAG: pseudouridine synthase [Eubacteriales bacterium]|nr:pseudouridine synthase [Eubacteriales bacterium]